MIDWNIAAQPCMLEAENSSYHNNPMEHKAIIICGSSRAGKTTLAKCTFAHGARSRGLLFEGLFPAYFSRLCYVFKNLHPMLFREYMQRPRYIDEKKSKILTPAEQLKTDGKECKGDFLQSLRQVFGEDWVIADLHAEMYYKTLLRAWPDVHFCLVIRDPRDCVCAGIHWLDYPQPCKNRKEIFYKQLFGWILSAHVGARIRREHPDHITIINSNRLRENDGIETLLGLEGAWRDSLPKLAYYTYMGNGKFSTPVEGEYRELLTQRELYIVQTLSADVMCDYSYDPENLPAIRIVHLKLIKTVMLGISSFSPSLARGLIMLLFSPAQHVKNQINRFKQFIRDIGHFNSNV